MATEKKKYTRLTIKTMFKGCPKPDGWFGCWAKKRGESMHIKVTGKTNLQLTNGSVIDTILKETIGKDGNTEYVAVEILPVTKTISGIKTYLKNIPGVSTNVADMIVKAYGVNAMKILQTNPEDVKDYLGLSDKQMDSILSGIKETTNENEMAKAFPELSQKIIKHLMSSGYTADEITNEPYVLLSAGVSFSTTDTIALRVGINPFDDERISNGLVHVLKNEMNDNLYVNLSDDEQMRLLMIKVEKLLKLNFDNMKDFGDRMIRCASARNPLIKIEPRNGEYHLYAKDLYDKMIKVIKTLSDLKNKRTGVQDKQLIISVINEYEIKKHKSLSDEQKTAVIRAIRNRLSIITGGPGRGKTVVIDCIAWCWYRILHHFAKKVVTKGDIKIFAPTGKAVNKLRNDASDMFKQHIMTIDKFTTSLEAPSTHHTGSNYPMNLPQTLVLVDESSMIDLVKFSNLLKHVYDCTLCFVGDIDQLPPIEAGAVFKDMILSNQIKTSILNKPFRNRGSILDNANKINQNDTNLSYNFTDMPFYDLDENDTDLYDKLMDQYNDEIDKCPDITEVALLSPVKTGRMGTVGINIMIHDIKCPENKNAMATSDPITNTDIYLQKGYPIASTIYGNSNEYTRFRVGDIVMNTKNNNHKKTYRFKDNDIWNGIVTETSEGIFNGECGRIIAYAKGKVTLAGGTLNDETGEHEKIIVQFFDDRFAILDINDDEFEHFDLGYAMTVHKSQGCEYNTVMIMIPKRLENFIMTGFSNKNLIYTAVTRAKQRVVIMGNLDTLNACIKNNILKPNDNIAERI